MSEQILFVTAAIKSIEDHFDLGAATPQDCEIFLHRQAHRWISDRSRRQHFAETSLCVALATRFWGCMPSPGRFAHDPGVRRECRACVVGEEVPLAETGQYGIVAPRSSKRTPCAWRINRETGPEKLPAVLRSRSLYFLAAYLR